MGKIKKATLEANGHEVRAFTDDFKLHYISLTDIASTKSDSPKDVIQTWMRSKETLEYLTIWESLNNTEFNSEHIDDIMKRAGSNAFTMSPQRWIELTSAKGIKSKKGRGGAVYACSEIALEFAGWISSEFRMYLTREFTLAISGNTGLSKQWTEQRIISSLNYKIHTDAVQEFLINEDLTQQQIKHKYATEADLINMALFGCTAKEWKTKHPNKTGNIRDNARVEELLVLGNLETYSAAMIEEGRGPEERLIALRKMAYRSLRTYYKNMDTVKKLSSANKALPTSNEKDLYGNQLWASVRNGRVENCGINKEARSFDKETGLCRNTTQKKKK